MRARVAIGVCAALPLTLMAVVTAGIAPMAGASGTHVGPVYPAPGSGTEVSTGAIGQTGGATFSFSGVRLKIQLDGMGTGSEIPAHVVIRAGHGHIGLRQHELQPTERRSRLLGCGGAPQSERHHPVAAHPARRAGWGGLAMETARHAHLGVEPIVGAVIPITTKTWSVNLTFEVSPDGGTTWDPADTYYDTTPHLVAGTGTSANASGAFWYAP